MNKYLLSALALVLLFSTGCTVPSLLQSTLEMILPPIAVGIAGLVTLGFAYLTGYIKSKFKSSTYEHATTVVSEQIEAVTLELIDDYKVALMDALKDGVIDEAEKAKLKGLAISTVKERISAGEMKKLASSMGITKEAVGEYLASKISGLVGERIDMAVSGAVYNKNSLSGNMGIPAMPSYMKPRKGKVSKRK